MNLPFLISILFSFKPKPFLAVAIRFVDIFSRYFFFALFVFNIVFVVVGVVVVAAALLLSLPQLIFFKSRKKQQHLKVDRTACAVCSVSVRMCVKYFKKERKAGALSLSLHTPCTHTHSFSLSLFLSLSLPFSAL